MQAKQSANSSSVSAATTQESKPTPSTTKSLREMVEESNNRAKAAGKYLRLPHEGGTIILGAHAARQRAAELRPQAAKQQAENSAE